MKWDIYNVINNNTNEVFAISHSSLQTGYGLNSLFYLWSWGCFLHLFMKSHWHIAAHCFHNLAWPNMKRRTVLSFLFLFFESCFVQKWMGKWRLKGTKFQREKGENTVENTVVLYVKICHLSKWHQDNSNKISKTVSSRTKH